MITESDKLYYYFVKYTEGKFRNDYPKKVSEADKVVQNQIKDEHQKN